MPNTIAGAKCPKSWTTTQKKPQARLVTIPSRLLPRAPKPLRNSLQRPRRRCITRHATFLAAYRKTSSIAVAAKAAGIKPAQHYRWLAANAAYWEAFRELQEDVKRRLQDKVVELAMEGLAEAVLYRGRVCGTIEHHSDRLLLYFLKGAKPEQWRPLRSQGTVGMEASPVYGVADGP